MTPPINSASGTPLEKSRPGDPAWEVALLFPSQGSWTEQDYLSLDTNRLVEFSDGCLEVLPTPTYLHQAIVKVLFQLLETFVSGRGAGEVLFAPLPVCLRPGKYREPDIVFLSPDRIPQNPRSQPQGADLVMEVVSDGEENRERDLTIKPKEYADAGISEYWIVDPQQQTIRVLTLDKGQYRLHGEFASGETATSQLLAGFVVEVNDVFLSASGPT